MSKHRNWLLASMMAASLSGSAARADWDDEAAWKDAPKAQPVPQTQQMQMEPIKQKEYEPAWQGRMKMPGKLIPRYDIVRPGEENIPPQFRVPVFVEDTRGPMPTYGGGFGKVPQEQVGLPPGEQPPVARAPLMVPTQNSGPLDPTMQKLDDKGFFGGIKNTGYNNIDPAELQIHKPDQGPAWAKDKLEKKRHFIEGQEHHGNIDPGGFF